MNWFQKYLFKSAGVGEASRHDMAVLKNMVTKIMKGNNQWSDQEIQVHQNHPDILEQMLREKYKQMYGKPIA